MAENHTNKKKLKNILHVYTEYLPINHYIDVAFIRKVNNFINSFGFDSY